MVAVSNNGYALQFASDRLRGDSDIVEAAVSNQGSALRFASPDLRNDSRVIHLATRFCSTPLRWASTRIKGEEEIVGSIVERDVQALEHAAKRLRGDYPLIVRALENTWKHPSSNPEMRVRNEQTIRHVDINKLAVHLSSVPGGTFELMSLVAHHCGIDDTYTLLREINVSLCFASLDDNEQHVRVPDRKRRKIEG